MKTVLYARVSTAEQTLAHQQTQAEKAGFVFDRVVADHGVSGVSVKMRDRPEGRRLFDMLREGDTLVVRWVDRLGRNYADVTETIREFMQRGVIIRTIINSLVFDGSAKDPMAMAVRDAMIAFMSASAQAQAEALKIAQRAGIEHAKAEAAARPKVYKGRRPSYDRKTLARVLEMLAEDAGVTAIAKETGLTRQTVMRIRADPAAADQNLKEWGL
jgi:putative DNA-invertase from lambdoid prophage Rac